MIEDFWDEKGNLIYVKCPSKHKNMILELYTKDDLNENLDNLSSDIYNKIAHSFDSWDYDIYAVLLDDEIEFYCEIIFDDKISDTLFKEIIGKSDFEQSYLSHGNPVELALKEFAIKKMFECIETPLIEDYYDSLDVWKELYNQTNDQEVKELTDYFSNYMYMAAKLRDESNIDELKDLLVKLEYNVVYGELTNIGATNKEIEIIHDMHLYDIKFLGEFDIDFKIMDLELKNEDSDYYKAIKYLITNEDQKVKSSKAKKIMYNSRYLELYNHLSK